MKKLLIVRYPIGTTPEQLKESYEGTQRIVGAEFIVVPFATNVEKVELEIIYDPYYLETNSEKSATNAHVSISTLCTDPPLTFDAIQANTSDNFMGGKP